MEQRTQQIIEGLMAKPSKKPDFKNFKGSDVLKRAQQFMPMFIQTTDRLLSDPELLKQSQMDIKLSDYQTSNQDMEQQVNEADNNQNPQTIQMFQDIGVGVYDVNNENFDEKTFKPSSTRPIVKFNGLIENEEDGESSSEESDDSNLYYEFNSDSENTDNASATTKETRISSSSKPMIVDITPQNMGQTKKLKNKKRQRKQ